jgi:23S rRNA pseudouridine2457 synthase
LRLIRYAIGAWTLDGLAQAKWEDLEPPKVPGRPKPAQLPNRRAQARRAKEKAKDTDQKKTGGKPRKPRRPY